MVVGEISNRDKKKIKYIVAKNIIQGPNHENNLCEIFEQITNAMREQFNEDNITTLKGFMQECFDAGFDSSWKI